MIDLDAYDCRAFKYKDSIILTDLALLIDDRNGGFIVDPELIAYLVTDGGLKPIGVLDETGLCDVKMVPDPTAGYLIKLIKIADWSELELIPDFLP